MGAPGIGSADLLDESRSGPERLASLRDSCQHVTEDNVGLVLSSIRRVFERLTDPQIRSRPEYYIAPNLLKVFLEECAPRLSTIPQADTSILELAAEIAASEKVRLAHLKAVACQRITDSPAPLDVRQNYMLRVIKALGDDSAPEVFNSLVTGSVVPQLRDIAFGGHKGSYNRSAVDLLAEYGDIETARQLRELARLTNKETEWSKPPGPIWKAEAQHNPDMLLEYIASAEWTDYGSRAWAVRKAVQLEVDAAKIRTAILAHAANIGQHPGLVAEIGYLKAAGLADKILHREDLPGIHLPQTQLEDLYALGTRPASQPASGPSANQGESR